VLAPLPHQQHLATPQQVGVSTHGRGRARRGGVATGDYRDVGWKQLRSTHLAETTRFSLPFVLVPLPHQQHLPTPQRVGVSTHGRGRARGEGSDVGWRRLRSTHLRETTRFSLPFVLAPLPHRQHLATPQRVGVSTHGRGRARGECSDGGLPRRRVETTALHPPRGNDPFLSTRRARPTPTSTAPSYTTASRGKHAR